MTRNTANDWLGPLDALDPSQLLLAMERWRGAAEDAWRAALHTRVEDAPDPVAAAIDGLERMFLDVVEVEGEGAEVPPDWKDEEEIPMLWGAYWEGDGRALIATDPRFHVLAVEVLKQAAILAARDRAQATPRYPLGADPFEPTQAHWEDAGGLEGTGLTYDEWTQQHAEDL